MNFVKQEWNEREKMRKNKMNSYIGDLKKQIDETQRKRQTQYIWEHMKTVSPAFIENDEIKRACDSCEKTYPEKYLTTVPEPFEL